MRARQLLKDYSLEEILEAAEVTPEEALEYLAVYGILNLDALGLNEACDD